MREKLLSTFLLIGVCLLSIPTDEYALKGKSIRIEFKSAPMSDVLKKL